MKRSERSILTNWWHQIDWWILGFVAAFSFVGLLTGLHSIHIFDKILLFYAAGALIFFIVPMMPKQYLIALSWILLGICAVLFAMTYLSPHIINQSRRWAFVFGFSFMPADLLKPAFIVLTAWFLTTLKRKSANDFIGDGSLWESGWWPAYAAIFTALLAAMFFHPDLGNMFIYIMLFGAMLFWAGAKMKYMLAFSGIGAAAAAASLMHPHFRTRILNLTDPYQVNRSLDAIKNGGLWGRGEESFLFSRVPMANNDFVFAGIAEMWGAVLAAAMLAAMLWLFLLLFKRAYENRDEFSSLVIFGAAVLFALHVIMNTATALGLFMKGTTLPFISYGGSSLLSFCFLFAIVLALARIDKWGASK
ncbi:MAG: FtsW/RodA/SpoVE family cell cycle protein [Rickettsiales bacterium]|jgi:cell division protein FtsW|nr:FtsW/RodA/SpoVE family cell cycle protein [Rickettsiales bacterium]